MSHGGVCKANKGIKLAKDIMLLSHRAKVEIFDLELVLPFA